jgi:hypothetical protein
MKLQLRLTFLLQFLNRHFQWVVAAVIIIILAVGFFTVITAKWKEVSSFGLLTLERERALTDDREAYVGDLQQSLNAFQAYSEGQIATLERVLPSSFDVAPIFLETNELFADAGYSLERISIIDQGKVAKTATASGSGASTDPVVQQLVAQAQESAKRAFLNPNLRVINLSLDLAGSSAYEDIKRLLQTIEQGQRLMDIQNIGFTIDSGAASNQEETSSLAGKITLAVQIYYFDEGT